MRFSFFSIGAGVKRLAGALVALAVAFSCETKVDIPDEALPPKPVLFGKISPADSIKLFLARTASLEEKSQDYELLLCNLTPVLTENGVVADTLQPCEIDPDSYHDKLKKAYYTSGYPVIQGNVYGIRVNTPYGTLEAETGIPSLPRAEIESVETAQNIYGDMIIIDLRIDDPPGEDNYYVFFGRIPQDSIYGEPQYLWPYTDIVDPLIEGDEVTEAEGKYCFSDRLFDGREVVIRLYFYKPFDYDGPILFHKRSIDENFYAYYRFVVSAWGDWDISGITTDALLPEANVKGGYGWWCGYNEIVDTLN